MRTLKIILLIILSIFFISFSFVYMLGLGVERTFLNIDYYEDIAKEYEVFDNLHQNFQEDFLLEQQTEVLDDETKFVNQALVETFSSEWLEEQALMILEDVLSYIKGEKDSIDAKIDLSEKENEYVDVLTEGFSNLDYVTGEFEELEPEMLAGEILKEMNFMEDEIYISEIIEDEAPEVREFIDGARMVREYFPMVAYITMGIVLVIMSLLASLPGGINWYGANMLIAGSKLFAILFLSNHFINSSMIQEMGDIPLEAGVVASVISRTTSQIMVVPIVYGAIGLMLIIIGFICKKFKKNKEEKGDVLEDYKVS